MTNLATDQSRNLVFIIYDHDVTYVSHGGMDEFADAVMYVGSPVITEEYGTPWEASKGDSAEDPILNRRIKSAIPETVTGRISRVHPHLLNKPRLSKSPRSKTLQAIGKISRFEENWDGYGSPPIDSYIAHAVRKLFTVSLSDIKKAPDVVPMSGGGIQVEWHGKSKHLEFTFESPDTVEYQLWDDDSDFEEDGEFKVSDQRKARSLVRWFMSE